MSDTVVNNRRLVVRVSQTSMAFSAVGDGHEVVYRPYELKNGVSVAANLREALQTVDLLQSHYGSVLAMVDAPVLLVPEEEFSAHEAETLYRHAFTGGEQRSVVSAVMPDLHCVALFPVDRDLQTVLSDHFGRVRCVPCVMPVWLHLHQRSYTGPRDKLYAYFHDRRMEVFAFGKNRFRFCNTFSVVRADDALYYLLSVWKQLGMEAERDELFMVGDVPADGGLREKGEEFIKRVYTINPVGEFNRAAPTRIAGMPYDLVTLYVKGI